MAALTNRYEDDDAYHLPSGMRRVGYDERTERYTFRQGDELWLGEPGSLYGGTMKWVGKVSDTSSDSDEDAEYEVDDEYDSDGSEQSRDDKSFKKHVLSVYKTNETNLPYLQDSKNEWGVPIASISDTNAKPPDTSLGRRGTQLKKAVTAITVTRRWSRRKVSSTREDQEASSVHRRSNEEKGEQVGLQRRSTEEKELPTSPEN